MKETGLTPGRRLSLLGGWRLEGDNGEIAVPNYKKERALFAYLSVESRPHHRDKLGALFWPDSPNSRANLRQALATLRDALGDKFAEVPLFLSDRDVVGINPQADLALDTALFTEPGVPRQVGDCSGMCDSCLHVMERQVNFYRGEFLEGIALTDCEDFEEWLQIKRVMLHGHALALLGRLMECHERAGHISRALIFARRYIEIDPWDESGQRRLMHLLVINGQAFSARKHFDSYARALKEQFGAMPETSTLQLVEKIRAENYRNVAANPHQNTAPSTQPVEERRQVTVMYCELRADGMDPEEAAELLSGLRQQAITIIHRYGGYLAPGHGGSFLVYFGFPIAQENAARFAINSALEIRRSLTLVQTRMGIHTGLIVTSSDLSCPDVAGQVSRIAVLLGHLGGAGEIIFSSTTHALVVGYFESQPLDVSAANAIPHTISMFRLLNATDAVTRLDTTTKHSRFVGRKTEVRRLLDLWEVVKETTGVHGVLVKGEAGIGKSRLIQHVKELFECGSDAVRTLYCHQEYCDTSLHPLIHLLENISGFIHGDSDETKLGKLNGWLSVRHQNLGSDALPLLGHLLGIDSIAGAHTSKLAPQQERKQVLELLTVLLNNVAAAGPLLLIIEDLHWADPSTLEVLREFIEQRNANRILLLMTSRPEFIATLEKYLTVIDIGALDGDESFELLSYVDSENCLPDDGKRYIAKVAGGIPLYLEELAAMPMDGVIGQPVIPPTLHDLLMAHIDKLGDARKLLQAAAAIGQEFDRKLLEAVIPCHSAECELWLSAAERSGLVEGMAAGCRIRYRFRHALIQEAAYQSQTQASRIDIHRRIAQELEGERGAWKQAPDLIAWHYHRAGEYEQAAHWRLVAGMEAASYCANEEALTHFEHALGDLRRLPQTNRRDMDELRILIEKGNVLVASTGYGSKEANATYFRAFELSRNCGGSTELFRALWGMYLGSSSRTHHFDSMAMAERLLETAEQSCNPQALVAARYACANSSYSLGNFLTALEHVDEARKIYSPEMDEGLTVLFGEHPMVSALFFSAWSLWMLGKNERAMEVSREASVMAARTGHPHTMAFSHCAEAILYRFLDRPEMVRFHAEELSVIARKYDFAFWMGVSQALDGWSQAAQGEARGAVVIKAALDNVRSEMFSGIVMYLFAMLIEAYGMLGDHNAQAVVVDEAIDVISVIHDYHYEAELYRLKAERLMHARSDRNDACAWLNKASHVARRQGAVAFHERIKRSMSGLQKTDIKLP